MSINNKKIGLFLIISSLVLIMILVFVKIQDEKQGAFLCELVAKDPSLSMKDCPAHERTSSWFILAAFGFAFLILASGIYLMMPQRVEKENSKNDENSEIKSSEPNLEVNISKLDSDEKKIYDLLKLKDGSIYQSDIIKLIHHFHPALV